MTLSDFCAACDHIKTSVVIGLMSGVEAVENLKQLWDYFVEVNYGTL